MPNADFPFGYRLPTDVAWQIRATAAPRDERPARPVRVHRLHWARRAASTDAS
jgi:hypothetical protein